MRALVPTFVVLLFLVFDYGVFATQTIRGSIGSTVRISCDVTIPNTSIFWRHQRSLGVRDEYVVIRKVVMPAYRERYKLTESPPPGYVLTIQNLTVNDAGLYTCIEEDGLGKRHYAKLEVHGLQTFNIIVLKHGEKAVLPCQGTFVRWVMQKPNSDQVLQIYGENGIAEEFKLRLHVSRSDILGDFMLTISDVDVSDSGSYTCIDSTGVESRRTYNLTVEPLEVRDASLPSPQNKDAPDSLSSAGVIAIAVVIPTVFSITVVLIIVLVIVPFVKKSCERRALQIQKEKERLDEYIELMTRSSFESEILEMKFKYLRDELAKLDLADAIAVLASYGIIDHGDRVKLNRINGSQQKCEELLNILSSKDKTEPFVHLRQSMAMFVNYFDFIWHMDELVIADDGKSILDLHSKASSAKKELLNGLPICGVTLLDKKLFVLRLSSVSDVEVYNAETYALMCSITVIDLKDPADITSYKENMTKENNTYFLYISDKTSSSVHKIELSEKNQQKRIELTPPKWSVGEKPRGLSVTSRPSVLVCCVSVNMIKEFTMDGKFLRDIKLPSNLSISSDQPAIGVPANEAERSADVKPVDGISPDKEASGHEGSSDTSTKADLSNDVIIKKNANKWPVDSPWHAVEVSTDRFVVCHGKQEAAAGTYNCINRVCIINASSLMPMFFTHMAQRKVLHLSGS